MSPKRSGLVADRAAPPSKVATWLAVAEEEPEALLETVLASVAAVPDVSETIGPLGAPVKDSVEALVDELAGLVSAEVAVAVEVSVLPAEDGVLEESVEAPVDEETGSAADELETPVDCVSVEVSELDAPAVAEVACELESIPEAWEDVAPELDDGAEVWELEEERGDPVASVEAADPADLVVPVDSAATDELELTETAELVPLVSGSPLMVEEDVAELGDGDTSELCVELDPVVISPLDDSAEAWLEDEADGKVDVALPDEDMVLESSLEVGFAELEP
ncbi:hypothetical protein OGATHE_000291 [Ogataea polymorpha]|uniref:Uncharacterized protein n=1 Tax=Ogataea polymorpha TaxID=460523 RepID=A0A9P8THM8_9ASCO|nr:hypothetical protein OGATHE_000291 [Ogataea polymorpha]